MDRIFKVCQVLIVYYLVFAKTQHTNPPLTEEQLQNLYGTIFDIPSSDAPAPETGYTASSPATGSTTENKYHYVTPPTNPPLTERTTKREDVVIDVPPPTTESHNYGSHTPTTIKPIVVVTEHAYVPPPVTPESTEPNVMNEFDFTPLTFVWKI